MENNIITYQQQENGVILAQNEPQPQILFRCSSLGKLITDPKTKADKEAGVLSETAKTLVHDMFLANNYGYKEKIYTNEMLKGLLCEQDSMALVQSVLGGEFRTRYNTNIKNEYISGTPDIVLSDCVEDLKTSYNLRTFFNSETTKDYFAQAQGYMWLTGVHSYRLIYCLVPTPEDIVLNEQKKAYYQFNCNEENKDYQQLSEQIKHNNDIISRIPSTDRIKIYEYNYDQSFIDKLIVRITQARNYYQTLKLNMTW